MIASHWSQEICFSQGRGWVGVSSGKRLLEFLEECLVLAKALLCTQPVAAEGLGQPHLASIDPLWGIVYTAWLTVCS